MREDREDVRATDYYCIHIHMTVTLSVRSNPEADSIFIIAYSVSCY